MNERIKELMIEAGYLPDSFGIGHWDMPECKKFAELIIRECCDMVSKRPYVDDGVSIYLHPSTIIKKHFGVEE